MNIPTQYNNEALEILNRIADDAMSLAIAAECVAPSYIEQCLRTVLEFHPYADRVKVAETSMSLVHGGVAVTYEIMPDEYVEMDPTPKTYQFCDENKEALGDEAYFTITEGEYLLAYQVLRETYSKEYLPKLGEPVTWLINGDEHDALINAFCQLAQDFPNDEDRFFEIAEWLETVDGYNLSIDL
jgi:hypothetical protein